MRSIKFLFAVLLTVALGGCAHDHNGQDHETASNDDHGHGHAAGSTAVTLWTDRTELFMEYPTLVVGEDATFVIHFSKMDDFKPVTIGSLTTVFVSGSNQVSVTADAPARAGIFLPVIRFDQAGVYDLELQLNSSQVKDVIRVPDVQVYARASDVPHAEEEAGGDQISFLKEQQWKIDFSNEPAQVRQLSASVRATGEILPKIQAHAEVPALVNGVVSPDQNANMPSVGTWVKKGQVLAVVSPPANTDTGLNEIRKEYLLAQSEYERAQRLFEKEAISKRRLDEARLRYDAQRASFDVIKQQVDFGKGNGDMSVLHFHVTAPIDGIVEEIHFHAGEAVETGQRLFTLTNPKRVWLKAKVPLALVAQIKDATDASFTVEGYDREFRVSDLNGKLISVGSIADRISRTVPVIFELDNPESLLKINMFADVSVKTKEISDMLAIPTSAIYDDDGTPVTYVQTEGEAFERRFIKTGIQDQGYTQILDGIRVGERVVTEGGYQVRLASLSTSVPSGHGHAH